MMRFTLCFFLCVFLSLSLNAQREFADLGTLKLSQRKYKSIAVDQKGNFVITYGEPERRYFRVYDKEANIIYSHTLSGYVTKVSGPLGYLQNDSTITFYFPPINNKFDFEKITVNKTRDEVSSENIKLLNGKGKIISAISEEHAFTLLLYKKKDKSLEYIRIDKKGEVRHKPLQASEVVVNLVRKINDLQLISGEKGLDPEQLIGNAKIYPRNNHQYLITIDPQVEKDRGTVKLVTLDVKANSLTYHRLLNTISPLSGSVKSFVNDDKLYRLIIKKSFFDLSIFQLKTLELLKDFHYEKDDDFDLTQSEVKRIGGTDASGSEKYTNNLKKSDETLRKLSRGNPILSVDSKSNGLKTLIIGSYSYEQKESTYFSSLHAVGGGFTTFSMSSHMGRPAPLQGVIITKLKLLFNDKSLAVIEKKNGFLSDFNRIRNYSRRHKDEVISIFSFEYTKNRVVVAVEDKKGVVKLISFRSID